MQKCKLEESFISHLNEVRRGFMEYTEKSIWKSKLEGKYYWKFLETNFNTLCETVYGIHVKLLLWPYANYASLWNNIPEN
jgi:hypothetical protein